MLSTTKKNIPLSLYFRSLKYRDENMFPAVPPYLADEHLLIAHFHFLAPDCPSLQRVIWLPPPQTRSCNPSNTRPYSYSCLSTQAYIVKYIYITHEKKCQLSFSKHIFSSELTNAYIVAIDITGNSVVTATP